MPEGVAERDQFLFNTYHGAISGPGQVEDVQWRGVDGRDVLKEVANTAVEVASMLKTAKEWEVWSGEEDSYLPLKSWTER